MYVLLRCAFAFYEHREFDEQVEDDDESANDDGQQVQHQVGVEWQVVAG